VAASFDGHTMRIFVNGALVAEGMTLRDSSNNYFPAPEGGTYTLLRGYDDITIGGTFWSDTTPGEGFNRQFSGMIDEFRAYDKGITFTDIAPIKVTTFTGDFNSSVDSTILQWRDDINDLTYVKDLDSDQFFMQKNEGKECPVASCPDGDLQKTEVTSYSGDYGSAVDSVVIQWSDQANNITYVQDLGDDFAAGGSGTDVGAALGCRGRDRASRR